MPKGQILSGVLQGTLPGVKNATLQHNDNVGAETREFAMFANNDPDGNGIGPKMRTLDTDPPSVAPVIIEQPVGATVDEGTSYTFEVLAVNSGTYQWNLGGVPIDGAVSRTYTIPDSEMGVASVGNYTVDCTNAGGTTVSAIAALVVDILAPVITTQPQDQPGLVPGNALVLTVAADNAHSYQWRKDTVDIPGATTTLYGIESVVVGDSGAYDCNVTNVDTVVLSDTATVVVTP